MALIELLEDRITDLEKKVYGYLNATDTQNSKVESSVIDSILHANTLISSAVSGREKANLAIKRLPELNTYLDPVTESIEIPLDAKLQVLVTMENDIRENYNLLTQIQELTPMLETDSLRNVPELSKKLNKLSLVYLNLNTEFEDLNTHVNEMFSKYNTVMTSISKLLITLNAAVMAAEIAAIPKKVVD